MRKNNNPLPVALSVIAIAFSAYALFAVTQIQQNPSTSDSFQESVRAEIEAFVAEKSGQAPRPSGPVEVSLDDDPVKGDKNAPVTILEFSDYECPFCGRFFNDTFPQIQKNYIDTGKVKYVFRDFPLDFHANAKPAANAAECLREQGGDEMYYEYHDVLFSNQQALSVDDLKSYAADFNVNQSDFATCLDEGRYDAEIAEDLAEGQKYGVNGTPGFFINGVPVSGAQPYSVFEAAIEAALK